MKRAAFSPLGGVYVKHLKSDKKYDMPVQHYHDGYEVYIHLAGKRYLFYDNICYTLERGDLVLFKPFDIHYTESREADYYERYVVNFQSDMLNTILTAAEQNILFDKISSCVIRLSESETNDIFGYFERVDEYAGRKGFLSEKLLSTAIFQLMSKAVEYTENKITNSGRQIDPQIIAALKYINENYNENISLDRLSDEVHMSKYYFCRKFHKTTGAAPLEYLNNVRLTKVHNLLINTKMSIEEISGLTGFSSAVNLTRAFKKVYGHSPRAFRKEHKKNN